MYCFFKEHFCVKQNRYSIENCEKYADNGVIPSDCKVRLNRTNLK